MEAMVIDVENEAFDEYMSMADAGYDDLRTEADIEELSVIEAIMIDEREPMKSDIADLPDVEVWSEEIISPHTVSADGHAVAHVHQANIMEQELRTLSEQGISLLEDDQSEDSLFIEKGVQVIDTNSEIVMETNFTDFIKEAPPAISEHSHTAEALENINLSKEEQNIQKAVKRQLEAVVIEETDLSNTQDDSETKTLKDTSKLIKKVKKSVSKKRKESDEAGISSESNISIDPQYASTNLVEQNAFDIENVQILEAAPSLKELIVQSQFAEVLEASQIEAIIQQQVTVLSGAECNVFNLEDPHLHQAVLQQLSAAVVAQQMEQGYFSGAQDMQGAFSPDETSADFSEFHSLGEPIVGTEQYGFESTQQIVPDLAVEQFAEQNQESYNQAVLAYENQHISAGLVELDDQAESDIDMIKLEAITTQESLASHVVIQDVQGLVQEPFISQLGPTIESIPMDEESVQRGVQNIDGNLASRVIVSDETNDSETSVVVTEPPELILDKIDEKKRKKSLKVKKRTSEDIKDEANISDKTLSLDTSKKSKIQKGKNLGSEKDSISDELEIQSGDKCIMKQDISDIKMDVTTSSKIENDIQEAIAAVKPELSKTDIEAVISSVEQINIESKPIKIFETSTSSDNKDLLIIDDRELNITGKQLEHLKSITCPEKELRVSIEVKEPLSDGIEVTHKVISPKSSSLIEKLIKDANSDDGIKSVPVFEILEIKEGNNLIKRKTSLNTADIICSTEQPDEVSDISVANICATAVKGVVTGEDLAMSEPLIMLTNISPAKVNDQNSARDKNDPKPTNTQQIKSDVKQLGLSPGGTSADPSVQLINKENEKLSRDRKNSIQQNIQQAIAKNVPELTVTDLEALQATLEKFVTVNKPIELIELMSSEGSIQVSIGEPQIQISPHQLEEMKLIKDIAADLGIAVEVTETVSEHKQVIHKIISPKSQDLMEKLIESNADENMKIVPVFEITEIVDEGRVVSRKTSVNIVEVVSAEQISGTINPVYLEELCTTAVSDEICNHAIDAIVSQANVINDSTNDLKERNDISEVSNEIDFILKSDTKILANTDEVRQNTDRIKQSTELTHDERSKEVSVHKKQIKRDIEMSLKISPCQLTKNDVAALQSSIEQCVAANKPVDVFEVIDANAVTKVTVQEKELNIPSEQLTELKLIENPTSDLHVAVEVTENLSDGTQITHKVISPKNEEMIKKFMNCDTEAKVHDDSLPIFEITEFTKDGTLIKRKTSLNKLHVVDNHERARNINETEIAEMCLTSLSSTISEELSIASTIPKELLPSNECQTSVPNNFIDNQIITEENIPNLPSTSLETESASSKNSDSKAKAHEPVKVKSAKLPSEDIVSACEEILNAQGGFVEASDIMKYLDISSTADEYLDKVIELSNDPSTEVDDTKEALLNKKKILLQKKQELLEKQEIVKKQKEIELAASSSEVSTITYTSSHTEAKLTHSEIDTPVTGITTNSESDTVPNDVSIVHGSANKSKSLAIKSEIECKDISSESPIDISSALQSKLSDASKQAEAILKTLETGIASPTLAASQDSNTTIEKTSLDSSDIKSNDFEISDDKLIESKHKSDSDKTTLIEKSNKQDLEQQSISKDIANQVTVGQKIEATNENERTLFTNEEHPELEKTDVLDTSRSRSEIKDEVLVEKNTSRDGSKPKEDVQSVLKGVTIDSNKEFVDMKSGKDIIISSESSLEDNSIIKEKILEAKKESKKPKEDEHSIDTVNKSKPTEDNLSLKIKDSSMTNKKSLNSFENDELSTTISKNKLLNKDKCLSENDNLTCEVKGETNDTDNKGDHDEAKLLQHDEVANCSSSPEDIKSVFPKKIHLDEKDASETKEMSESSETHLQGDNTKDNDAKNILHCEGLIDDNQTEILESKLTENSKNEYDVQSKPDSSKKISSKTKDSSKSVEENICITANINELSLSENKQPMKTESSRSITAEITSSDDSCELLRAEESSSEKLLEKNISSADDKSESLQSGKMMENNQNSSSTSKNVDIEIENTNETETKAEADINKSSSAKTKIEDSVIESLEIPSSSSIEEENIIKLDNRNISRDEKSSNKTNKDSVSENVECNKSKSSNKEKVEEVSYENSNKVQAKKSADMKSSPDSSDISKETNERQSVGQESGKETIDGQLLLTESPLQEKINEGNVQSCRSVEERSEMAEQSVPSHSRSESTGDESSHESNLAKNKLLLQVKDNIEESEISDTKPCDTKIEAVSEISTEDNISLGKQGELRRQEEILKKKKNKFGDAQNQENSKKIEEAKELGKTIMIDGDRVESKDNDIRKKNDIENVKAPKEDKENSITEEEARQDRKNEHQEESDRKFKEEEELQKSHEQQEKIKNTRKKEEASLMEEEDAREEKAKNEKEIKTKKELEEIRDNAEELEKKKQKKIVNEKKKEVEEEKCAEAGEFEKKERKEKEINEKKEAEEEKRAEAEELEKKMQRKDEKEIKSKNELDEEKLADTEELEKKNQREEEIKRKKEVEEEKLAETEEFDTKKQNEKDIKRKEEVEEEKRAETEELEKKKQRKEEHEIKRKTELGEEKLADAEELEKRKEIKRKKETEEEKRAEAEELEKRKQRKEEKEIKRENELDEEKLADAEELEKKNQKEKEIKRKNEVEEEKRAETEELEKKKQRKEEQEIKRKKELEEERLADAEELEKKKEKEKEIKRKKEVEEEKRAEAEEFDRKKQNEKEIKRKKEVEEEKRAETEELEKKKQRKEEQEIKRKKELEEERLADAEELEKKKEKEKEIKRKKEVEEEKRAEAEEFDKKQREKEIKRKKEIEEEKRAEAEELEKKKQRKEEQEIKRKKELEEEKLADAEKLEKKKQKEKEKENKRKKELEEEERVEAEEFEKKKQRQKEKIKAIKEHEEKLMKEEEDRQVNRKKQREDRERTVKEEEERLRKLNEEREESKLRKKSEDAARKKEEEAREREIEKRRQDELAKGRKEAERKRKDEEKHLLAEEEQARELRRERKKAEELALKLEHEKFESELEQKREKRKKIKEAEDEEEKRNKDVADLKKKLEVEARLQEKKRKEKQWEEEERAYEEAEQKRRESKIKRNEADKLRAQEEEMLADLERKRVDEDKKRLEAELRRREESKRKQEDEIRKQGEEFLKKVSFWYYITFLQQLFFLHAVLDMPHHTIEPLIISVLLHTILPYFQSLSLELIFCVQKHRSLCVRNIVY